jgi:hypothetical protein
MSTVTLYHSYGRARTVPNVIKVDASRTEIRVQTREETADQGVVYKNFRSNLKYIVEEEMTALQKLKIEGLTSSFDPN